MFEVQLVVPVLNFFTDIGVILRDNCNFAVGRHQAPRKPCAVNYLYSPFVFIYVNHQLLMQLSRV
jgi:hypothetical protein